MDMDYDLKNYRPSCDCAMCTQYRTENNLKKGEDPRKKTKDIDDYDLKNYRPNCDCTVCTKYRIKNNLKKGEDPRKKTTNNKPTETETIMLNEYPKKEIKMSRTLFDYVMYDMGEGNNETEIEPDVIDRGSVIAGSEEHARFILFRNADFNEDQEAAFLKGRITIHFHNRVNLWAPGSNSSGRY